MIPADLAKQFAVALAGLCVARITAAIKTAVSNGCDDPMILYLYARSVVPPETYAEKERGEAYRVAAEALIQSQYAPLRKFYGALRAAETLNANRTITPPEVHRWRSKASQYLNEAVSDKAMPPVEVYEACEQLLRAVKNNKKQLGEYYRTFEPIIFNTWPSNSLPYLSNALSCIARLWRTNVAPVLSLVISSIGTCQVRLATSAIVVSQTWGEVHRVNSRVRDALKSKGLLGANDTTVQALDRLDLTNAQKRDERFYPQDAVVIFNQKVREAEPGAKGKLAGILKSNVLVEVGGKFVTVSNKMLGHISVCQPRNLSIAIGDRLHLKANRKLASGGRVTNDELVTAKSVRPDGGVELTDGRVLDASFREFLSGYAVTSYGSQGKTVDYVLFSDSTVKAATNAQQWYVTISRGRRGIRIFTPDKEQLRENVTRSGHRPLALELTAGFVPRRGIRLWDRLHGHLLRFGQRAADTFCRLKLARRRHSQTTQKHEHKNTRMLVQRPERSRRQNRTVV